MWSSLFNLLGKVVDLVSSLVTRKPTAEPEPVIDAAAARAGTESGVAATAAGRRAHS